MSPAKASMTGAMAGPTPGSSRSRVASGFELQVEPPDHVFDVVDEGAELLDAIQLAGHEVLEHRVVERELPRVPQGLVEPTGGFAGDEDGLAALGRRVLAGLLGQGAREAGASQLADQKRIDEAAQHCGAEHPNHLAVERIDEMRVGEHEPALDTLVGPGRLIDPARPLLGAHPKHRLRCARHPQLGNTVRVGVPHLRQASRIVAVRLGMGGKELSERRRLLRTRCVDTMPPPAQLGTKRQPAQTRRLHHDLERAIGRADQRPPLELVHRLPGLVHTERAAYGTRIVVDGRPMRRPNSHVDSNSSHLEPPLTVTVGKALLPSARDPNTVPLFGVTPRRAANPLKPGHPARRKAALLPSGPPLPRCRHWVFRCPSRQRQSLLTGGSTVEGQKLSTVHHGRDGGG